MDVLEGGGGGGRDRAPSLFLRMYVSASDVVFHL